MLLNSATGEIDDVISIKLPKTNSSENDFKKLENFMRNLPDSGEELRDFISITEELSYLPNGTIPQISSAEIRFTDIRTGVEKKMLPSLFKLKIKSNYDPVNNFRKLTPQTIGISRAEFDLSAYHAFRAKLLKNN